MRSVVLSLFHPDVIEGGGQRVAYELFRGLNGHRGDVSYFVASVADLSSTEVLRKRGGSITGFEGRQREFLWWNDGFDEWLHRNNNLAALEELVDWLIDVSPDVVFMQHFFRMGVELIPILESRLGIPVILTLHEYLSLCPANGHLRRWTDGSVCSGPGMFKCHECIPARHPEEHLIRQQWIRDNLSWASGVVVPSASAKETLLDAGWDQGLTVIENGVAVAASNEGLRARDVMSIDLDGDLVFGFFGQALDDKGLSTLLDATELLRRKSPRGWRVRIFGGNAEFASPALRDRLSSASSKSKRRVTVHGPYAHQDVVYLMSQCDVIVMPSVWPETYGLVLDEARLARRPVIVSDLGAPARRVNPGVDGWIFRAGHPEGLAHAMLQAMSAPLPNLSQTNFRLPSIGDMVSDYRSLALALIQNRERAMDGHLT